jgi:hypothetical protein
LSVLQEWTAAVENDGENFLHEYGLSLRRSRVNTAIALA